MIVARGKSKAPARRRRYEKNDAANLPSIGDRLRVAGLGHRPFGSQGKQECLCYLKANHKACDAGLGVGAGEAGAWAGGHAAGAALGAFVGLEAGDIEFD